MEPLSPSALLTNQSKLLKDKTFCVCETQQVSYAEFNQQVTNVALHLLAKGIVPDQTVGVLLPNSLGFLLAWFALNRLGACMVPINPRSTSKEVGFVLEHADIELTIVTEQTKEAVQQSGYLKSMMLVDEMLTVSRVTLPTEIDFPIRKLNAIASILYTSGTTGTPKGVMVPNSAYLIGGQSFAQRAALTADDRMMIILPLFHINAQVYSTIGCLVTGATLVIKSKFSASTFWSDVITNSITQFNFLGVAATILLKQPRRPEEQLHHVRIAFGAGLSRETIEHFETRFGIPLIETYGLTECPMGTSNLLDNRKLGSIGKPSRHPNPTIVTQLRLVDESDAQVSQGSVGEIVLRSPALFTGYFKNPEATAESMRGGWFHTGDMAYEDSEGFIFFVDRSKDIIRKKGENISSREVEQVILALDEVQEVAVVPIPGALGEDDIKAFVVLKAGKFFTEQAIRNHCSSRLSQHKIPAIVEFVATLPKTPTEKIVKTQLRESYRQQRQKIDHQIPVYLVDGIRTPFGKVFGALQHVRSDELLANCLDYLVEKHHLDTVDDVIIGCTNQSGEESKNVARMAVLVSRLSNRTPGSTVNRLSASGLEAIRLASTSIRTGEQHLVLAGGVDSSSRSPYVLPRTKSNAPAPLKQAVDSMTGWRFLHPTLKKSLTSVGETAESLTNRYDIKRADQDLFAQESNTKVSAHREELGFELLPMSQLTQDEIPRDITLKRLSELKPLYTSDGCVTAGNASKLADGAGVTLLASEQKVVELGLHPLAKIVATRVIATDPGDYGTAPVHAINALFAHTGLTLDHMGVIELHEAYAVQVLACLHELRIPAKRINQYGGALALGHPYGASGIRLALTAARQLQVTGEEYALISMCIGGGQAMAMILQRA